MKIGTIQRDSAALVAVASDDNKVVVLQDVMSDAPADMLQVINGKQELLRIIEAAVKGKPGQPVDSFTWLPPVPRPGKVICVALNDSANKDRIMKGPDHPVTFIKPSSSLIEQGSPIPFVEVTWRVENAGTRICQKLTVGQKNCWSVRDI